LLFSEYLHEKTEESRHNESVSYLIVLIGSVYFVGGLLTTVVTAENPEWFLIIPYHLTPHPYSLLGLTLTSVGITLLIIGICLGIHYARERVWYIREMHKAHSMEEAKLNIERKLEARAALHEAEEAKEAESPA
jgi:hypothetical protein